MNKRAVLKGFFFGMMIFSLGTLILTAGALFTGKGEISWAVRYLFYLALIGGGFTAGFLGRRRGYLHGACVGILWWMTKYFFTWFFFPGAAFSAWGFPTLAVYLFWGILGGLGGVNYLIIRKQEERGALVKVLKN